MELKATEARRREELARGSVAEELKAILMQAAQADPHTVVVDLDQIFKDLNISAVDKDNQGQVMMEIAKRALDAAKDKPRPRRRGFLSWLKSR